MNNQDWGSVNMLSLSTIWPMIKASNPQVTLLLLLLCFAIYLKLILFTNSHIIIIIYCYFFSHLFRRRIINNHQILVFLRLSPVKLTFWHLEVCKQPNINQCSNKKKHRLQFRRNFFFHSFVDHLQVITNKNAQATSNPKNRNIKV